MASSNTNLILIVAILGGGYLLLSGKKPAADKGYKIIKPCQEFEIYNEEKSLKYAYTETYNHLNKLIQDSKPYDEYTVFKKLFGCDNSNTFIGDLSFMPKYYKWVYKMQASMNKALVDKMVISETTYNTFLQSRLADLQDEGFETVGLPLNYKGDLVS